MADEEGADGNSGLDGDNDGGDTDGEGGEQELQTATLADFQDGGQFADVDLGLDTTLPMDARPSPHPNLFGSGWGTPLQNGVRQNRIGTSPDDRKRFENFKLYCQAKHGFEFYGNPAEDLDSIYVMGGASGLRYQCVEYAGRYHGMKFQQDGGGFGAFNTWVEEAGDTRPNFVTWGEGANNTVYRPAHGDAVYITGSPGHVGVLHAPDLNAATHEDFIADSESYSVSVYQQNLLPSRLDYTLTRTHTGGRPGSGRWELAKSGDSGEV